MGKCVYCVNANEETKDHVPPKSIFAKDNRDDLIRVPACFDCNNSFSKDDEWLVQLVATNAEFQEFPGLDEVKDRALRAVSRPESYLLESMVSSFRNVELWSSAGIYLGNVPAIEFDGDRFGSIIARIVRGLFWHETRRILPEDYVVHSFRWEKQANDDTQNGIAQMFHPAPIRSIGGGAFEYHYRFTSDEPNASIWVMRFYLGRSLEYVAATKKESSDG